MINDCASGQGNVQYVHTVTPIYYTAQDVQEILGIKPAKAYAIIKELREELVKKGYANYPQGKVPKKYFNERYYMSEEVKENVLQHM